MLLFISKFIECASSKWTANDSAICEEFVHNHFKEMKANAIEKIEESLSSTEEFKTTINKLVNDSSEIEKLFENKYDDELLSLITTEKLNILKQKIQLEEAESSSNNFYSEVCALKPMFLFFKEVCEEAVKIIQNKYSGDDKNIFETKVSEKVKSLEHNIKKLDEYEFKIGSASNER